uniref:tagaturonate reductase n=1 Tax=Algoriphagus sp. TaxID=1872435 RepID=UPI004047F546
METIHILQFGTGNFLRGFIEPLIEEVNQKGKSLQVCLVQSTQGSTLEALRSQNFQYSLHLTGIDQGEVMEQSQKITCIKDGLSLPQEYDKFLSLALQPELKWVISNVTEAGIAWQNEGSKNQNAVSFGGRLTQWLHWRYTNAPSLMTTILPCELVPSNGKFLEEIIRKHALAWNLGTEFLAWLTTHCRFFNTLVDRIVPGFPSNFKETQTPNAVQAEPYLFWGIEGTLTDAEEIPFANCKGVVVTESLLPYAQRKISILNGLHTYLAAVGMLKGIQTVQEYVQDYSRLIEINQLLEQEIFPYLNQPLESLQEYGFEIIERFKNPFLAHALLSISLQSISKFRSRLLPICLHYSEKNGELPPKISKGLVALLLCHLRFFDQMKDSEETKKYFENLRKSTDSELKKIICAGKELYDLMDESSLTSAYDELMKELSS